MLEEEREKKEKLLTHVNIEYNDVRFSNEMSYYFLIVQKGAR